MPFVYCRPMNVIESATPPPYGAALSVAPVCLSVCLFVRQFRTMSVHPSRASDCLETRDITLDESNYGSKFEI